MNLGKIAPMKTCCQRIRQISDNIMAACMMDTQYDPFNDIKKAISECHIELTQCTGNCEPSIIEKLPRFGER